MDKDRQIRFLYPPLIFLGSLAFGIWFDKSSLLYADIEKFFSNQNNTSIAVALIGITSIVLLFGFLLGTITILILRGFFPNNRFNYEFKLSEESYQKIGKLILRNKKDKVHKKDRMFAVVVFDHSYIHENVHRWIARRWNAFLIASSSVIGLVSSLIVGNLLNVNLGCSWIIPVIILIVLFILQGYSSWIETMRMIEFMTRVKKDNTPEEKGNQPEDLEQNGS